MGRFSDRDRVVSLNIRFLKRQYTTLLLIALKAIHNRHWRLHVCWYVVPLFGNAVEGNLIVGEQQRRTVLWGVIQE